MDEVELIKRMVEIYSPTGKESVLADYLIEVMEGSGFEVRVDEVGNIIGQIGSPKIYLIGHLDTVEGEIPIRIENDILYGRGSVDAKAALAAMICAASKFNDIAVIGLVDEEGSSKGALHFLKTFQQPDFAIFGEPSGWDSVTIGYRGRIELDVLVSEEEFHSAAPGKNAIEQAVMLWNRICEFCNGYKKDSTFYSLDARLADITISRNGFLESVMMKIRFRIPIGFRIHKLIDFVNREKGRAVIKFGELDEPILVGRNNILVRSFISAIRAENGEPKFKLKSGTCDMNILGKVWKCPVVAYGPGNSDLDHMPNEHISLEEYKKSISVLSRVLKHLIT